MGKIAFLFSGQGAQHPGMGKELYENFSAAKELFDSVEPLKEGNKALCFDGSKEELAQTVHTQPCLYTVDLAAALSLVEAGVKPDVVAGFSLGELAALSFAGAMDSTQGFDIVCKRGQFMQSAGEERDSVMMAVLKLSDETVETLCGKYNEVYPVNYNYPGQLVISGAKDEMELLKDDVKAAGGRAVPLPVSGGFHSPFMASAEEKFKSHLATVSFKVPTIPVYANYTAGLYGDNAENIPTMLEKQLMNPVRWQTTIENMIADGVDTFIETGVGKTLSGFVAKISKDVKVYNVEDAESLKATVEAVLAN